MVYRPYGYRFTVEIVRIYRFTVKIIRIYRFTVEIIRIYRFTVKIIRIYRFTVKIIRIYRFTKSIPEDWYTPFNQKSGFYTGINGRTVVMPLETLAMYNNRFLVTFFSLVILAKIDKFFVSVYFLNFFSQEKVKNPH